MKKFLSFIYKYRATFVLVLLLGYVAYLHGANLTNFPYYESDEGTYTSQAWSLVNDGELSPYTYWYDHPPVGWMTIAAWYSVLPDSYFTFGNSVDTGRVLMLLLFVINSALVFYIVNRLTKSVLVAALAVVVYASSPLGIYYTRRVLLDNVQVLWLLLSIVVLLPNQLSLRRYAASGAFFALAFLTKITAVMFGIPMLFLVLALKDGTHKVFRVFSWLSIAGVVTSVYFVYALIKNELFPPLFPSSPPHVSFWETIAFQMARGGGSSFYEKGSDFMNAFNDWLLKDPVLVLLIVSTLAIGALSFFFVKNVWYRFFVLMNLFYVLFLIRGGLVIDFYIIPLLPFSSILLALIVGGLVKSCNGLLTKMAPFFGQRGFRLFWVSGTLLPMIGVLLFHYNFTVDQRYLYVDETKNQILAVEWVKKNLPESTDIMIDSTMYVELHDPKYINDKVFENAEWFYKVSRDTQIRDKKYNNNWQNFDYLLLTHEMLKQISLFDEGDIVHQAFVNSLPKVKWFENSSSFIDEQKMVTTNGDWTMLYDVNSETGVQLVDSWQYYKENYIFSYGQVIDPWGDVTTSEGQSYAMLRAVWMNDHDTFKGVWEWTQHHMQHRIDDKLISWKWTSDGLADSTNAVDADIDIALALLFANKNFNVDSYYSDAEILINDIWEQSVVDIDGTYYLVASNESEAQVYDGLLINPSYMSPAHFRIFAEVDQNPNHNWQKLADDTYKILSRLTAKYRTPLPKNWYVVNPETGDYYDAAPYVGSSANEFSYDSFRIFWRTWLDYAWFNNQRAENYLSRVGEYMEDIAQLRNVPTRINPETGEYISTEYSLALSSSYVLPLSLSSDASIAREYYNTKISEAYSQEGYWGDGGVYYDQNWVWLVSAFYNHDLFNIWDTQ